jgi:hypothetical protein
LNICHQAGVQMPHIVLGIYSVITHIANGACLGHKAAVVKRKILSICNNNTFNDF